MTATPTVAVQSLTHRYQERVALNAVSFDVPPSSIFCLLGPNGGGKTTLFKILATLLQPTSGTILVNGADVVSKPDEVRRGIGIVFQRPSLDGKLTVRENLMHQGHLYGLRGNELRARSGELLERFGVADRAGDRVDKLSGGLQRRVELAKSLLHRPRLLVLDEPSTGLDPGVRIALMQFLTELRDRDGVTSLLTTHLMDEAAACDHVAILDQGKLVAIGTPNQLREKIGGDIVTMTAPEPTKLASRIGERFSIKPEVVDGVVRIERERGHEFVPTLIEAFPGEIDSVTVGKPTLDDVFVHLTGRKLDWESATEEVDPRRKVKAR